jgi:Lrp/AsnC family leucine-responsive transcriptional regulator
MKLSSSSSAVMDSIDRKIVTMLRRDPYATQAEIAEELGLSQPSVAARMKRLKEDDLMLVRVGLDPGRAGLLVGKVEFTAKDPQRVLQKFQSCPCLIGHLVTSGRNNMTLFFASEWMTALQGIVDHHLRGDPEIEDVNFSLVVSGLRELAVCPTLCVERREISPCGGICTDCLQYARGGCTGCPATVYYRGSFYTQERGRRARALAEGI